MIPDGPRRYRKRGRNVLSIGLTGSGIDALDWIDISHPESDAHIVMGALVCLCGGSIGAHRPGAAVDSTDAPRQPEGCPKAARLTPGLYRHDSETPVTRPAVIPWTLLTNLIV
jgi:hypothetical protein